MAAEKTYLELSEETGAHKFYEVVVDGKEVSIRYGRIGDEGRLSSKMYDTEAKAQADAKKKLNSKMKKGYEEAVMGVREKRSITRRAITSRKSTSNTAPVLWNFASGSSAFGIFIDEQNCWVGNEQGKVFVLDHDGGVQRQFKLPNGVKCIVADDDWRYAGCDDGMVYDLSGKAPFVAYEIEEDVDIYWLDIRDGILGVSDSKGNVHTFNHEDETQWSRNSDGRSGWMVRCDEIGVYHGHSKGVTMYDWEDGTQVWHTDISGSVLFGWQEESTVYAGTSSNKVYQLSKQGKVQNTYQCDNSVYSCAAAEDGVYVFAGDDNSSVYCFDQDGNRLWKLGTGCGSAFSMQYINERLYIVTTNGSLACIDASEEAIRKAKDGDVPKIKDIKAPTTPAVRQVTSLETTSDDSDGVILECYKQGGKLRVRAVSSGYDKKMNVQFPKNIREAGARYIVDELRESDRGGFYRAFGDIKKLDS